MTLQEYYDLIADTPRPSAQQLEAFANHVVVAHSWYKHLALGGAEFVVFLDPGAGGGFSEDQPRIHHTWATRQDYFTRFGHLAYMYRHSPLEHFATDYAMNARVDIADQGAELVDKCETAVLDLPRELLADSGFTLYPFACDNGVFFGRFEPELSLLEQGHGDHACRELLLAYYRAETAHLAAYAQISEESRELTLRQLESASAAAWRRLEEHELAKVRNALARLSEHVEASKVDCH